MKPRVLFADDDAVVEGLRRTLWRMRARYDMVFVAGYDAALAALVHSSFDVAVVDPAMRGPGGMSLLAYLRAERPDTLRIAFSGTCEAAAWVDALALAHRFVSKPSSAENLVAHIDESVRSGCACSNGMVTTLRALSEPQALPKAYRSALAELTKPEPVRMTIARSVASDIGLTARLLKLANSAWIAPSRPIDSVDRAVEHLGMELVHAALLLLGIRGDDDNWSGENSDLVERHGTLVGTIAAKLVAPRDAAAARSAGLLHDIGRMAFARVQPIEYRALCADTESERELSRHEFARFGGDHTQCGAFLLGLWGLPPKVVASVANHHDPVVGAPATLTVAEAVRVAELAASHELDERWAGNAETAAEAQWRAAMVDRVGQEIERSGLEIAR